MRGLSEDDRREVAAAVLGSTNRKMANTIWLVVDGAFAAVVLVSVIYFVGDVKLEAPSISGVLTLVLDYLAGLV